VAAIRAVDIDVGKKLATQGLLVSVMQLLKTKVPVADYTILCRRRRTREVSLLRQTRGEPLHVVVDATGIEVFGKGGWKVKIMVGPNGARGGSYL
jgi:hypothetical protein